MKIKLTISNILIIISTFFTMGLYINPNIGIFSINNIFLDQGNYILYFLQFFSGTFMHGGILHLFMNSIFIYYFGNQLEHYIGKKKYIIFFLSCIIFLGITITKSSYGNTIGISGFAMALLSYYTILLYTLDNPEYKGGITALIVNIGIGYIPGISFIGHLSGAIYGLIFFLVTKKNTKN